MKKEKNLYRTLFLSTLQISAFTFGGGFVIIPLMRRQFVERLRWIEDQEMMDLTAIAQSSPGAIAVNASILVGYQVAGLPGALITVLGTVLPPLVILSAISFFYDAFRSNPVVNAVMMGMQAGVAAVICDVVLTMGREVLRAKRLSAALLLLISFVAVYFFKVNILLVLFLCGTAGAIGPLIAARKENRHGLS